MAESDGDLVRLAKFGDRRAFSTLVDRHWEPLRRWLCLLSGHATSADDVTQDAFLQAWSSLHQLADTERFRSWLYRIARNLLFDRQRDARGRQQKELADVADTGTDPLSDVLEREGNEQLQAALQRLPSHYREVYLLWTRDDWPYHQIAEVLEISEETARWRVCVARQLLVKELKAYLST